MKSTHFLDRFIAICATVTRVASWIFGGLIFVATGLIAVEVVLRKLFRQSLPGVDEMIGFLLALATAWGLSLALVHRQHIRVDILHGFVSKTVAALLDLFAVGSFVVFIALVAWHGTVVLAQSWVSGSRGTSPIPAAIPQALWVVGLGLFVVVGLALIARCIIALRFGDTQLVSTLIGPRSAVEEAQEVISAKERSE